MIRVFYTSGMPIVKPWWPFWEVSCSVRHYCWPMLPIVHMFLVFSRWRCFYISLFEFCTVFVGAYDRVIQRMSVGVFHSRSVCCLLIRYITTCRWCRQILRLSSGPHSVYRQLGQCLHSLQVMFRSNEFWHGLSLLNVPVNLPPNMWNNFVIS